ncbi:MAG: hypothetical protein ACTIMZ_16470 [Pseudoalteromonas distincta]|uniref:hypothetical protein n=1 Tax=Pseudoalteromonas distincta TaxID=77608 RepID=UPI003F9651D8
MNSDNKEILKCVKVTSNPFSSNRDSSLNLTISAIDMALQKYSNDQITQVFNKELMRLNDICNNSPGSMLAYEMLLTYKSAQYNCAQALKYLKKYRNNQ